MPFPPDPGLVEVLERFEVRPPDLIGHGGEAWVYALDDHRVIRVLHAGGMIGRVAASADLVSKLARSTPKFALPQLVETGEVNGRSYSVEARLPGRPVAEALAQADDRVSLIEAYLEASAALGDLALDHEDGWGDLLRLLRCEQRPGVTTSIRRRKRR